ncbi:nuclear transport factor 2 family protein [Nocardia spumae]|uniref:nuclear transport factor 2 family protein n=1 Tax=Nocardia spumae TaxID=2887190 RepID=UPI001D143227|nr:nuclear transport factor 2 family protein [Nocardia spumae]
MSEYETHTTIAERYIETWNEGDDAVRRKLLDELYLPGATYTDPLAAVTGVAEIGEMIAGVRQQFAGMRFTLGPVDGHHDQARFTWSLGLPDAEPLIVGFDVIVRDGDRIASVYGFLDRVPS